MHYVYNRQSTVDFPLSGPGWSDGAAGGVRAWPDSKPVPAAGGAEQGGLAGGPVARRLHLRSLRLHPALRGHARQAHRE